MLTGKEEYNKNKENKIEKLIESNPGLEGFYYFISEKSNDTIYNYLLKIEDFLIQSKKNPEELNFDDFTRHMLKAKRTKTGKTSTASYRVVTYQALKLYGKYLVVKGILNSNPMDMIERPSAKDSQETIEKRERGFLSEDEIKQYLNAVKTGVGNSSSRKKQKRWRERDLAIITLLLTTGMRCSALYKIDVNDIDFENQKLLVTDKGSKVKEYRLANDVLNNLRNWVTKRNMLMSVEEQNATNALFISHRRTRITTNAISDIVSKYAVAIEGKNITPHKLRATYGTQLYNATKDIYFVQECMSHASPTTTERYIRGQKNKTEEASAIMGALINI